MNPSSKYFLLGLNGIICVILLIASVILLLLENTGSVFPLMAFVVFLCFLPFSGLSIFMDDEKNRNILTRTLLEYMSIIFLLFMLLIWNYIISTDYSTAQKWMIDGMNTFIGGIIVGLTVKILINTNDKKCEG